MGSGGSGQEKPQTFGVNLVLFITVRYYSQLFLPPDHTLESLDNVVLTLVIYGPDCLPLTTEIAALLLFGLSHFSIPNSILCA